MKQAEEFERNIDNQLSRWIGAIPVLIPILRSLNVVAIINRYCPCEADVDSGIVALILALNRLMSPRPLYKVADWMAETVLEDTLGISAEKLHDRRIGDLLDAIHPYIDNIWKEVVYQALFSFGISLSFIHYDITSVYFEGKYEDSELLDYGYSRDDKTDCKQVNLGLNITGEDGIPLFYKVINGSTTDRTTPIENMNSLRELLNSMPESHDFIQVSDQAMLDRDVIVEYHNQDVKYLGPLQSLNEYEDVLMSVSTEELLSSPLDYRPQNQKKDDPPIYYGMLSNVSISGEKINETVEAQALILYSTRKAKLDSDKRNNLLDKYLGRLKEIHSYLNTRKYKKAAYTWEQIHKAQSKYATVKHLVDVQLTGTDTDETGTSGQLILNFEVNAEKLAYAKEKDGRYMLVTNSCLTANDMLIRFKEQDKIEKRNRTIKGPIQIRPIFLHKQERIESLIFICMLSLLVFSILEMLAKRANIDMTGKRIFEQFQTLTVVYTIFKDGSFLKQLTPLTEFQNKFITALDFYNPEIYLKKIKLE